MSNIGVKLSALLVLGLLGMFAYSSWTLASDCTRKAHEILAAADPLDAHPPSTVARTIQRVMDTDVLSDMLATVLLDRYKCRRGSELVAADWLIDRLIVRTALRYTFDEHTLVGLAASTADMGHGIIGLNRGALKIYKRDIGQLEPKDIDCLLRQYLGQRLFSAIEPTPAEPYWRVLWMCPTDGVPPPPPIVN